MEGETMQIIESLFQEKALLYADLVECFRKEHAHLNAMDVESLWGVADEKNRICSEIGALRSRIASTLDLGRDLEERDVRHFLDRIPVREQGSVRNVLLRIMKLKSEVEMMRKENKAFIEESLDFLDGMISLLAGERAGAMIYSGRRRLQRTEAAVTLSREV
jgi:hypothetical protein